MSAAVFGGENAESYYDEGVTATMRGDVEQAIGYFKKAIDLDRSMGSAYHQLGKCYARLGQSQEAANLLGQVVKQRPQFLPARVDLGLALLETGQFDDARSQFQQVLALDASNARAHLGLAQADFYQGNWQGALQNAQAAHVHQEDSFAVVYMLGRCAKLAGDTPLAQRTLGRADALMEKYLEVNPEKPEGYFLRGEVAFVSENFPAALQYYQTAEKYAAETRSYLAYNEQFSFVDILAKQGLCHQRLDNPEEARRLGRRIEQIDPAYKLGKALRES